MNSVAVALSLLYLNTGAQAVEDNSDAKVHFVGLEREPPFDSFSGYLNATIKGREQYFFYFLTKSQTSTAAKDPLILWLNGGPGCSSLFGMFTELGPFRQTKDGSHLWENLYAWNKVGHVLALESPGGVGFSYRADGRIDGNDDNKTAEANYMALVDFLKRYPEFEGRDFFITGESYAGVYLPYLAKRIIKGTKAKEFKAKFKGMAIGNGYLHLTYQQESMLYLLYYRGTIGYKRWNVLKKHCCLAENATHRSIALKAGTPPHIHKTNERGSCVDSLACWRVVPDSLEISYNQYQDCYKTSSSAAYDDAGARTHRQPHKRITEDDSSAPMLNYDSTDPFGGYPCWAKEALTKYLTNTDVMESLHVSKHLQRSWTTCNNKTVWSYPRIYDMSKVVKYVVENSDAKILIYNGDLDWVCNFLGIQWFVRDLAESSNLNITKSRAPWYYRGKTAGFAEAYGSRIDLLTVKGAGHMVPTDRPGPALQMIANFIGNTDDYSRPYVFTPAIPKTTKTTAQTTTVTPSTSTKGTAGNRVEWGLVALAVFPMIGQKVCGAS